MARTRRGRGIRLIVYGLLNILSPESIVASGSGGRTVASQVLGGGEAGPGDHVVQDGAAEIVPGGREAGPVNAVFQNTVKRFRGQVLVQPS